MLPWFFRLFICCILLFLVVLSLKEKIEEAIRKDSVKAIVITGMFKAFLIFLRSACSNG